MLNSICSFIPVKIKLDSKAALCGKKEIFMIHDSNRYAASTCPECGEITKTKISAFSFSGRKVFGVTCHDRNCSARLWEIHDVKDKYRINIKCPACDEVHTYTMSKANFWNKPYFSFNCPTWDVNILYFGVDEHFIDEQMDSQDENILDMFENFADFDDNVNIMYELVETINDLAKADKVKCDCKKDAGDITMNIDDDKVFLACKKCRRTKTITASEENIDLIMQTGTIVLDDTIL